jgi:hypothetical protein
MVLNFIPVLFSGHTSNIFLLSVIQASQTSHNFSMSSDLANLMLSPKKPFLDKKNRVAGLDLPNSSNPTKVKLCSLFSKTNLCKSVNVVE